MLTIPLQLEVLALRQEKGKPSPPPHLTKCWCKTLALLRENQTPLVQSGGLCAKLRAWCFEGQRSPFSPSIPALILFQGLRKLPLVRFQVLASVRGPEDAWLLSSSLPFAVKRRGWRERSVHIHEVPTCCLLYGKGFTVIFTVLLLSGLNRACRCNWVKWVADFVLALIEKDIGSFGLNLGF